MTDLTAAALTFLAAWDANRARVGDLLVSEAVLAAVEGIRAALADKGEAMIPDNLEEQRAEWREFAETRPLDVLEEMVADPKGCGSGGPDFREELRHALFRRYAASGERVVSILYRNHRGEVAWRRIIPERAWFGLTDWHPAPESWLLHAWDCEKEAERDFALGDVQEWGKRESSGNEPPRSLPEDLCGIQEPVCLLLRANRPREAHDLLGTGNRAERHASDGSEGDGSLGSQGCFLHREFSFEQDALHQGR